MKNILDSLEVSFRSDGRRVPMMPWQILGLFAGVQESTQTIGTAAKATTEDPERARIDAIANHPSPYIRSRYGKNEDTRLT
jgi:hypothetical protein